MKVNIKGQDYEIKFEKEPIINDCDVCLGLAEFDTKTIRLLKDLDFQKDNIIAHELIHCYLYESGLTRWASDELLVQWIAMNIFNIVVAFEKIEKEFKKKNKKKQLIKNKEYSIIKRGERL